MSIQACSLPTVSTLVLPSSDAYGVLRLHFHRPITCSILNILIQHSVRKNIWTLIIMSNRKCKIQTKCNMQIPPCCYRGHVSFVSTDVVVNNEADSEHQMVINQKQTTTNRKVNVFKYILHQVLHFPKVGLGLAN